MKKDWEQLTENPDLRTETILVLRGGGSLGAYECWVYNTCIKVELSLTYWQDLPLEL